MTIVRVHVDDWQFACCETFPAAGDTVRWQLAFRTADQGDAWLFDAEPHGTGTLLRTGGVAAYWPEPSAHPRGYRLIGTLHEDHHGLVPDDTPPTTGTVLAIAFTPDGPADRVVQLDLSRPC